MRRFIQKYYALLKVQLSTSATQAAQYRVEFLMGVALSAFWTLSAVAPLWILFQQRSTVAGWRRDEALVVVAFFTMLKGFIAAFLEPSVNNTVEHLRKGTLDFLLLKPADAGFLVSTTRLAPWKGTDIVGGLGLLLVALRGLGRWPAPTAWLAMLAVLAAAVAMLHALWIMVVALAFVTVKVDNLTYLLGSLYDAARWPASVWRGPMAFLFSWVLPLAVMTTDPALAVLGRLQPVEALRAVTLAAAMSALSRAVWLRSITRYTSAGG